MEIKSPLKILTLKGHSEKITVIDYSSNGKYFFSTSEDRTLRLYENPLQSNSK